MSLQILQYVWHGCVCTCVPACSENICHVSHSWRFCLKRRDYKIRSCSWPLRSKYDDENQKICMNAWKASTWSITFSAYVNTEAQTKFAGRFQRIKSICFQFFYTCMYASSQRASLAAGANARRPRSLFHSSSILSLLVYASRNACLSRFAIFDMRNLTLRRLNSHINSKTATYTC